MHFVRDGLFIGDITDAADVIQTGAGAGGEVFTHVLSILSSSAISFFNEWRSDIVINAEEIEKVFDINNKNKLLYSMQRTGPEMKIMRMAVQLRDTEDENLLDCLEQCLNFIDQAKKNGTVIVHCFAGVSRSAAVVTAYLMRTEKKSVEEALESLRQCCGTVCPNDGFLDQLSLFEEMAFKVDTSNPIYKRFHLKVLGHSYKLGEKIGISIFGADPGLPYAADSSEGLKGKQQTTAYRCRKCRRLVALQDNVVSHVPGERETDSWLWPKKESYSLYSRCGELECSSLFVEPLKWMASVEEGATEGKLLCINCNARLGNFNWSGIQCNCGSWITPAFQIHKSKVDICTI